MGNNLSKNCRAGYRGEHRFAKCLSWGKFHLRNSCVFHHTKCFKCDKVGQNESFCRPTVCFATSIDKPCSSDLTNLGVSNDHLSLYTILKANFYINKQLDTSLDSSYDFTVDKGSIESTISFKKLKSLDSNIVVQPIEVSVSGIIGHKLLIRGC